MKVDNFDMVLRENKILYHKSNLNLLKALVPNNRYSNIIFSRFGQHLNYMETLLEQCYSTDNIKIKKDLLETIDGLSININDIYENFVSFIITKNTKINDVIIEISNKFKEILKIKTDVIILDGTEFVSTPYFTSKYKVEQDPVDSLFMINIDSSLGIFGIPQIVHEYGHLVLEENSAIFKDLIHSLVIYFRLEKQNDNIIEKIKELTCDMFSINLFGKLFIYSYITSFENNFNTLTEEHFDDYFRMKVALEFLQIDNDIYVSDFLSQYEYSSNDYTKYSFIINDIVDTYHKFFNNNYNGKNRLKKENEILSLAFQKLLGQEGKVNFREITESATEDLLRKE